MKVKNIHELLAGYCEGNLSDRETAELCSRIETDPEARRLFHEIRHTGTVLRMLRMKEKLSEGESWYLLQKKLNKTSGQKYRKIGLYRGVGIAACIVLMVAVGISFFRSVEVLPLVQQQTVISPGSTRATLLLADGEAIPLDELPAANLITSEGVVIANDSLAGLQYQQKKGRSADSVIHYHTIRVPRGGEYRFTLPDGSRIWINSASELRFPTRFAGGTRDIYAQGEIFCNVVQDQEHPFVVHVNDSKIKVLGTTFNLNAYPEEDRVTTTLVTGKVEFSHEGQNVQLRPGEQSVLEPSGRITKQEVDVSLYTSWVNGIFEYERMPLDEIIRQLARWYDVQFTFESEEFRSHPFTGFARRDQTLGEVFRMIEKTTDVKFDICGRSVIIKRTEDAGNISRSDY